MVPLLPAPQLKKESIAVHFSELLMNRNVEQGFSHIKYFLNTVLSFGIVAPVPLAGLYLIIS